MPRPEPGAGGSGAKLPRRGESRPHHISSVAHMFFADSERPGVASSRPSREVVVATPSGGAAAAWTAANLALATERLSRNLRVRLSERHDQDHSGAALLPATSRVPLPSLPNQAEVTSIEVRSDRTAATGGDDWIHWRHLGRVDQRLLNDWEAAGRIPAVVMTAATSWTGLVWCLDCADVGSLVAGQYLGRLLRVMRAAQLEIVVDEGRAAAGTGAGLAAEDEERLRATAMAVTDGLPPIITRVRQGDVASALVPLVRRLIATRHSGSVTVNRKTEFRKEI